MQDKCDDDNDDDYDAVINVNNLINKKAFQRNYAVFVVVVLLLKKKTSFY